ARGPPARPDRAAALWRPLPAPIPARCRARADGVRPRGARTLRARAGAGSELRRARTTARAPLLSGAGRRQDPRGVRALPGPRPRRPGRAAHPGVSFRGGRAQTMTTTAAPLTRRPEWKALQDHHGKLRDVHLRALFAQDPGRGDRV